MQPFTPCQLRFAVLLFLDGWLMPLTAVGMAVAMGERLHRMACLLSSGSRAEPVHDNPEEGGCADDGDDGDSFPRIAPSSCRLRGRGRSNDDDDEETGAAAGEDPAAVLDMFRRAQQQNSMRHEPRPEDDVVAMFRKAQAAAAAGPDPRPAGERLGEMI